MAAALLAAACGVSTTPVTVSGKTLQPASSEMMQIYGIPIVMVSDTPDLCKKLQPPPATDCNTPPSSGGLNPTSPLLNSTSLSLTLLGAADGARLKVLSPDAGTSVFPSSGAQVQFISTNSGTPVLRPAVSGEVAINQFRASQAIVGSYDVVWDNGERATGTFNARYCDALEKILASVNTTRSCGSGGSSPNSCTRVCSCGGRSVSASCLAPSDGGTTWTCDCTGPTGTRTTCSMLGSSSSCNGETGTCCPLMF